MAVFGTAAVDMRTLPDGAVLLTNAAPLPAYESRLLDRLDHWARHRPAQTFLAERDGADWRRLSYADARAAVQALAARLLALPLAADRPLLIVAPNEIGHALAVLASLRIGAPASVVAPTALTDPRRFADILENLDPGAVFLGRGLRQGAVRELLSRRGIVAVRFEGDAAHGIVDLESLPAAAEEDVDAAYARVMPDTIAKLLFTSGSTGTPKSAMITHRMMCSNMASLEHVWPFLLEEPPVLLDWLPWSHVFGGNCCFNLALYHGGTFHIDDGKPLAGLVERTVRNLADVSPTVYFNVPAGYEALLPYLESDPATAQRFFRGVKFLFSSGAAMPALTRERLAALAHRVQGRPPVIIGAWGATETAPFATVVYFETDDAHNLGIPIPGTTIKLAPDGGRQELRVKGPNVTPGYWRRPEATAAAFDGEGFYRTGDAGRLANRERPSAGLHFDGRIAENFKLTSGTWVNVGNLRLSLLEVLKPLVVDLVITGHGRDHLGVLLFPAVAVDTGLVDELRRRLAAHHRCQTGGSTRIERFALLESPPSREAGEITEKGSINQRAVLEHRAADVETLYAGGIVLTEPKHDRTIG
jgi:feruloyl-CoA synthase